MKLLPSGCLPKLKRGLRAADSLVEDVGRKERFTALAAAAVLASPEATLEAPLPSVQSSPFPFFSAPDPTHLGFDISSGRGPSGARCSRTDCRRPLKLLLGLLSCGRGADVTVRSLGSGPLVVLWNLRRASASHISVCFVLCTRQPRGAAYRPSHSSLPNHFWGWGVRSPLCGRGLASQAAWSLSICVDGRSDGDAADRQIPINASSAVDTALSVQMLGIRASARLSKLEAWSRGYGEVGMSRCSRFEGGACRRTRRPRSRPVHLAEET